MTQTLRQRRALSQRRLTPTDWQQARDEENRAAGMLFGAVVWSLFVLLCAVAGIAAADWWSGGAAFVASVPLECGR